MIDLLPAPIPTPLPPGATLTGASLRAGKPIFLPGSKSMVLPPKPVMFPGSKSAVVFPPLTTQQAPRANVSLNPPPSSVAPSPRTKYLPGSQTLPLLPATNQVQAPSPTPGWGSSANYPPPIQKPQSRPPVKAKSKVQK